MTAAREALLLPLVFLTVVLLAGLQIGEPPGFTAPSEFALVLACLVIGVLVRSGALVPERLLHGSRTVLENSNGTVVLLALFGASAQLLTILTPASGLPLLLFDAFLLVLLTNTLVAAPDRTRALRSLLVILGSAFLLKFVVLAALSSPDGDRTRRVLLALFDAATLGTISQDPLPRGSGYVAFAAIALYMIGAATLPSLSAQSSSSSIAARLDSPSPSPAGHQGSVPRQRRDA